MNLNDLEQQFNELQSEVSSLKGKLDLLDELFITNQNKQKELIKEQIINKKSVEVLNLVQKATKELVCNSFETIVTNALQFIHQNDEYKFELEFTKRGNIPELNFQVKTPDMQEAHDIIDTRGGGSTDIISLALRFVLLEISKRKGFVFLDEPFKHLDNKETAKKGLEFLKEMQKNSNRQIFIITHRDEIVEEIEKPIILTKEKVND